MTNIGLLAIYGPLCLISLSIIALCMRCKPKNPLTKGMLFLAISMLGWQGIITIYLLTLDFDIAYMLYDLNLVFVALMALSVFFFVLRFYGMDQYFSREFTLALLVIPLVTLILSCTNQAQPFLRPGFKIVETYPVHLTQGIRGPWFWVHAGYCYGLAISSCLIALYQHHRLPRIYRHASRLLVAGILVAIAGNALLLTGVIGELFDISLITASISEAILYISIRNNQGLVFMNYARKEAYSSLPKFIFVLDPERNVISLNKMAAQVTLRLGLPDLKGKPIHILFEQLARAAEHIDRSGDEESGIDYYYCVDDEPVIYNIRSNEILDKRKRPVGTFVVGTNVTENRALIKRLEDVAGMDALTGLYNYRTMAQIQKKLDNEEKLPLTVIMGDLNNLKFVNDTQGHQQGDTLLRTAAETLSICCPPSAYVGRIGGDEFMVLLPNCGMNQAQELVRGLRRWFERASAPNLPISMALGMAIKTVPEVPLQIVITEADKRMYADKEAWKLAAGNTTHAGTHMGPTSFPY